MATIGIIGVGNMGEAIMKGLIESGFKPEDVVFNEVSEKRSQYVKDNYRVKEYREMAELTDIARYIVIAVKPQDAKEVLKNLSSYIKEKNVIISVMAGISISTILSLLGQRAKIIRAMPNLCVKVKEGVIGICRNEMVGDEEFAFVSKVFSNLGSVIEVKEELFDAITAYAGSGPAFFLFFLEGMIDAGVKIGFSREKAMQMAEKIISGTMKLVKSENVHPSILKDRITSPGGTTISGITELEERAFKGAIIKAFEAATKRSKELSL